MLCICNYCGKKFDKSKNQAHYNIKNNKPYYCSKECLNIYKKNRLIVICNQCGTQVEKIPSHITKNNFCSRSCSVTYRNTHKTYGTRRSKLEAYIEEQLSSMYSKLSIEYNKKDAINSELDIYIPSLKLAFELNGIFHYEPIYGNDKLSQIQNNDSRKFQACIEHGIELCIIDTSHIKHFTKTRGDKILEIIVKIINIKLNT